MLHLRPALVEDLEAVVEVFLECWTVSYARVMPTELVTSMTRERALRLWAAALSSQTTETLLAEKSHPEQRVVGLVGFSLAEPGVGYVASLYVTPSQQGSGAGRFLLAAAEERLRAKVASLLRLLVFERNTPSLRFYERQGWVADGSRVTLPEWGEPQIGLTKEVGSGGGVAVSPPRRRSLSGRQRPGPGSSARRR
jgi:ribosomal protein S18 acetylase RimI-like enzyme